MPSRTSKPVPILMYHQVRKAKTGEPFSSLCVSPSAFRRQMWLLKLMGYRGVSMRELMPYLRGEKHGKVVGITFDDGYLNNLQYAAPMLRDLGFSSTCYLVSGKLGGNNDWDEDQGVTQVPLMDQGEVKQWLAAGQDIGCHTRHHVKLDELSDAQALDEMLLSKAELEQAFDLTVPDFCYPYGHYNDKTVALAEQAGFVTATTTGRSRVQPDDEPLTLPRVHILRRTALYLFAMKVWGRYEDKRRK